VKRAESGNQKAGRRVASGNGGRDVTGVTASKDARARDDLWTNSTCTIGGIA
jgi:hypothetical protein